MTRGFSHLVKDADEACELRRRLRDATTALETAQRQQHDARGRLQLLVSLVEVEGQALARAGNKPAAERLWAAIEAACKQPGAQS